MISFLGVVKGENPAEHQLGIISTCPRETGEKSLVHLAPDTYRWRKAFFPKRSCQAFANFFSEPEEMHRVYLKYRYCLIKLFQASRPAKIQRTLPERGIGTIRASTNARECLVLVPTQTAQTWSCTDFGSVNAVSQCDAYPAL